MARDADRLPNGNTLITDTHGNRVMAINESGDIVWEVESTLPYDAERLETGAESESGQSARELGLESRTVTEDDGGTGEFGIDPFAFLGGIVESILPIESITRSSSLRRSGWAKLQPPRSSSDSCRG